MDGFAFVGEALAGKFLGAGDFSTLRVTVRLLMRMSTAKVTLFTVGYLLLGDTVLHILPDSKEVFSAPEGYSYCVLTIPFA